ncbi:IclR family transcriptional regulator [Lysinibacillus yapensis]|uniref:IclR family transcriptional regulator n=1 Tax=Ureibacillus yapensis TaxID=2304605 RepID=UPI0013145F15|nr:IclR family transcriptional regulator [Lysinibacillus yapensis]
MKQKNFSSLENALRLLDLYSVEEQEFSLKEIANRLAVADSTAHRLLSTLKKEGFIAKDHRTNRYRLGVFIRTFESVILKDFDLYTISDPFLLELSSKLQGTVSLCILDHSQTFYLNSVDSGMPIYHGLTYLGKTHSVFSSSAGFVLLSEKKEEELLEKLSEENSVYSSQKIPVQLKELPQIQKQGYAVCHNIFDSDMGSIAVPIKNNKGNVIAAIEVIMPDVRLHSTYITSCITKMEEVAIQLTERLYNHAVKSR